MRSATFLTLLFLCSCGLFHKKEKTDKSGYVFPIPAGQDTSEWATKELDSLYEPKDSLRGEHAASIKFTKEGGGYIIQLKQGAYATTLGQVMALCELIHPSHIDSMLNNGSWNVIFENDPIEDSSGAMQIFGDSTPVKSKP